MGQIESKSVLIFWRRDGIVVALLLLVFFGFQLGTRALWSPVEGHYAEIAREMVVSKDYLTPSLAGMKYLEKPPLFYWLLSADIKLFGLNEWSLRFWPALFAALGCLALYYVGTSLFGRRIGLLASAILATSSLWYLMGHVIDLDMAVSVLISCALFSFLLGTGEPLGHKRRLAMAAFVVFSALATLTKGLIGVVIPAIVIGGWIAILNEWKILKTLYMPSGIVLFLLIAAPWFWAIAQANPDFLGSYFIDEHFKRYLTKPEGPFEQPWAYIPVLVLGMLPWATFLLQSLHHNLRFSWRQRHQHQAVIFLALWAALVFVFYSGSSYKGVPYILPIFPPLAILLARYFAAAWEGSHCFGLRSGALALFGVLSLLMVAGIAGPQHFLERYANWPALDAPAEGTVASARVEESGDLLALTPYLHAQSVILAGAAGAAVLLLFRNRNVFRAAFLALICFWALFLTVLNSSLPLLDQRRSVKSLAVALKSQLNPSDVVASYHAYYQDLPVYLNRPVAVIGWHGSLQFDVEVNDRSGGWMTDDRTFWQRWNGPETVFMLTEESTFKKLNAQFPGRFHVVARGLYDIVLSNQTG